MGVILYIYVSVAFPTPGLFYTKTDSQSACASNKLHMITTTLTFSSDSHKTNK